MSSCLSLFKSGLIWVSKIGQYWHEYFGTGIWKGGPILLLHRSHEAWFTPKGLSVKKLTFSIKCAVKFRDVITATKQGVYKNKMLLIVAHVLRDNTG